MMTDAERIELLHWMRTVGNVLIFVVVVTLLLAGLILWALYERRKEAERDARRLQRVIGLAYNVLDNNGRSATLPQLDIFADILVAAGESRREVNNRRIEIRKRG